VEIDGCLFEIAMAQRHLYSAQLGAGLSRCVAKQWRLFLMVDSAEHF